MRTDVVDGYQLDRGFHIFLDSYPEARRALDCDALALAPFYAGALVRTREGAGDPPRWQRVADPARHPVDALLTLLPSNTVGDALDKLRVGLLRLASLLSPPYGFLSAQETSSLERLRGLGFSERMLDTFWRPFLGGIFFDRRLGVSDRLLSFVMRSLATGSNCLPAAGIGAVSQQLASGLPLRLGAAVSELRAAEGGWRLALAGGSDVSARRAVVVAADGPAAARLLRPLLGDEADPGLSAQAAPAPGVGTVCLYFSAPAGAPSREPILYLNGVAGEGLVNNACFPSTVCPAYAPPGGGDLVSASLIGVPGGALSPATPEGAAALAAAVRAELAAWFGLSAEQAAGWRHLATYVIPFAQPSQAPPTCLERPVRLAPGLFVCGDHREAATLDGALRSGRRAAEAALAELAA